MTIKRSMFSRRPILNRDRSSFCPRLRVVIHMTDHSFMMSKTHTHKPERNMVPRGFTLVEVLIVVIILGVLAAIIMPHFTGAVTDAEVGTTSHELAKLRRAIEVYRIENHNTLPDVTAGDGTWGVLTNSNQYLKSAPVNPYVGSANAGVIIFRNSPDVIYHQDYGWIYDAATGQVWAGGFDASDMPLDN